MLVGNNTSPDVVAYVVMNGGKLLDITWSEGRAVFIFEYPENIKPGDYYSSEFYKFKTSRNSVMDQLNNARDKEVIGKKIMKGRIE